MKNMSKAGGLPEDKEVPSSAVFGANPKKNEILQRLEFYGWLARRNGETANRHILPNGTQLPDVDFRPRSQIEMRAGKRVER